LQKCECHVSGEGICQLSRWAKVHVEGFGQQNVANTSAQQSNVNS